MTDYTVRYFAAAAEAAGTEEERFDTGQAATLDELRAELRERYGDEMSRVLRGGSFLLDGSVRRSGAITGRTVDVLPPFAGG